MKTALNDLLVFSSDATRASEGTLKIGLLAFGLGMILSFGFGASIILSARMETLRKTEISPRGVMVEEAATSHWIRER